MSSRSDYAAQIGRIYQSQAENQAQSARQRGQIWAGTLANLSELPAVLEQNRLKEAELKSRAADRSAQAEVRQLEVGKLKRELDTETQTKAILSDPSLTPFEQIGKLQAVDPALASKKAVENSERLHKVIVSTPLQAASALKSAALRLGGPDAAAAVPNTFNTPEEYQAFQRQAVSDVEEFLKSTRPKEEKGPRFGQRNPEYDVINEATGEVVTPGTPRPAGMTNPTETSLALAAAKGDPEAVKALSLMRQQNASTAPEPLMSIMGPDGLPVYVPRSQAVGKRPANTREQGRPVTSGDAGRLTDIDAGLNDLQTLGKTIGGIKGATGTAAAVGAALPNWATNLTGWGTDAKKKQAVIDRVKQVIGKTLEGGVLRKEDEVKYERILPTISDPPPVVDAKLSGLKSAISQRKSTFLDNLSDAGYDTTRFTERSQSQGPVTGRVGPYTYKVK